MHEDVCLHDGQPSVYGVSFLAKQVTIVTIAHRTSA